LEIYYGVDQFEAITGSCVTTGTFDGVHFGHMKIISDLIEVSKSSGLKSVILTFEPHPRKVLFPDSESLQLLNTLDERLVRLSQTSVDAVVIQSFTKEFSRTTALSYVRDLLVEKLAMRKLVVGYDHQFGKNREGSIDQLREFATMFGFDVSEIPAQDIDKVHVSSTKIRNALLAGDLITAAQFLGYDYFLSGVVVHGSGRGRHLGFRTANVQVQDQDKLIPAAGVYAVDVLIGMTSWVGMCNIGVNPTFSDSGLRSIEVHIFDFEREIYGEDLKMTFRAKIRNEQKFSSSSELVNQLNLDKIKAFELLA